MTMTTGPISDTESKAWLEETRLWAEAALQRTLAGEDLGETVVSDAMGYALMGGGKRVRPALVRLVGTALGAPGGLIEAGAVAVECVHTYSLVHDDLPCMDDDDLRRGRATVHKQYDEATAVLVGDGLLTLAFEVLAHAGESAGEPARALSMVRSLSRGAGAAGMVGGQSLDLAGEGKDLGVDQVRAIHGAKTAALLASAAELGAHAAGADAAKVALAGNFGRSIGMCFQAMDDVLDVTGDAATLGKTPGKDVEAAKGTLVRALGLDGALGDARRSAAEARAAAEALGLGPLGTGLVDVLLARKS